MSVTTTTDETVNQMQHDVEKAVQSIHKAYTDIIVDGTVWGANEYSQEYKEKLMKLHQLSLEMRDLAGRPNWSPEN
jgi:hypothetical protein